MGKSRWNLMIHQRWCTFLNFRAWPNSVFYPGARIGHYNIDEYSTLRNIVIITDLTDIFKYWIYIIFCYAPYVACWQSHILYMNCADDCWIVCVQFRLLNRGIRLLGNDFCNKSCRWIPLIQIWCKPTPCSLYRMRYVSSPNKIWVDMNAIGILIQEIISIFAFWVWLSSFKASDFLVGIDSTSFFTSSQRDHGTEHSYLVVPFFHNGR